EAIESGGSFDNALAQASGWLRADERLMLRAFARQGRLPDAFRRLAARREQMASAQAKTLGLLAYPLFVVHVALVLLPVASRVQELFAGSELALGVLLVEVARNLFLVWGVLLLLWVGLRTRAEPLVAAGRYLPLFGKWLKASAVARLADALGLLAETGFPIDKGWSLAGQLSGDRRLRGGAEAMARVAAQGGLPGPQLARHPEFPSQFRTFYVNGERTGTLDTQMQWVARQQREEADRALTQAILVYAGLFFGVIVLFVARGILAAYGGYLENLTDLME
ncbi:MAG: type II secretion system F family protein, partial [Opitutales bacterium]